MMAMSDLAGGFQFGTTFMSGSGVLYMNPVNFKPSLDLSTKPDNDTSAKCIRGPVKFSLDLSISDKPHINRTFR